MRATLCRRSAFLLDPDGHKVEAVCHLPEVRGGASQAKGRGGTLAGAPPPLCL